MTDLHLSNDEERAVRHALMDLPKVCRFHGDDLERSGMRNDLPHCESCRIPWRARQAWQAFTAAVDRREYADQQRAESLAQQEAEHGTVVHQCPPNAAMFTPCCGRSPFELPRYHRMTEALEQVTCRAKASRLSDPGTGEA